MGGFFVSKHDRHSYSGKSIDICERFNRQLAAHKLLKGVWLSNSVLSLETLKILLQQEQASEQEDKEDKEEEPT